MNEKAATLFTQYLMLDTDGKAVFDGLLAKIRPAPNMAWTTMPGTALFLPPPMATQRSDPPLMIHPPAVVVDEEKEEEEEELSEQPLDEYTIQVCTPSNGSTCGCRYTLTAHEDEAPELDPKAVAIFFPNGEHSELDAKHLIAYVKDICKDQPSLIHSITAHKGRWNKKKKWVIPYVVVHCKTHKIAVSFYTLIRKAVYRFDLPISFNWGRKNN